MDEKSSKEVDEESKSKTTRKQHRLITAEPVMILYSFAFIPSSMLLSQFVLSEISERKNYTSSGNGTDNGYCVEDTGNDTELEELQQEVQATTARFMIFLDLADTIPELFIVMILGALSDVIGRKVALIIPICGFIIKMTIIILLQIFDWPLEVMIFAYFIDGMSGSTAALIGTCYSYMADIYKERTQRIFHMTVMFVCNQLGLAVSGIYLGFFIKATGFTWPLVFLGGIGLITLFYVIFILEESHERNYHRKIWTLSHLKTSLRVIFHPTIKENDWKLGIILTCSVLTQATNQNELSNLFVMNSPLCWGSVILGIYRSYDRVISKLLMSAKLYPRCVISHALI